MQRVLCFPYCGKRMHEERWRSNEIAALVPVGRAHAATQRSFHWVVPCAECSLSKRLRTYFIGTIATITEVPALE